MAGKRQHYIPQFLQTGFLSKVDGASNFTIVYRKGMQPKEISTRHVGLETHFYNKPDDTFLDDLITQSELKHYSGTIRILKENKEFNIGSVESVARLISHLQIRSRNLRLSVIEASSPVIDMFIDELNEPSVQIKVIKSLGRKQTGIVPKFIYFMLKISFMKKLLAPIIKDILSDRNFFEALFKEQASIAHQAEMKKSIEPKWLIGILMKLHYDFIEVDDFPLGDSMAIFSTKSNGKYYWKTLPLATDELVSVILPISKNKLLIGSADGIQPSNIDILNGIIECSHEFFISATASPELESKINNIGKTLT